MSLTSLQTVSRDLYDSMKVRITQRPPSSYDPTGDSLLAGRTYDLPSELAAALVIEGCAEFGDDIFVKERRQFQGGFTTAAVHDRPGLFERRKPPPAVQ